MLIERLIIEDSSPSKMTRFAEHLWGEHPDVIVAIGEENIIVTEVPPTIGGMGDRSLIRSVDMNLSAKFYEGMPAERAAELVKALAVIREVATGVGITLNEQVDDFLNFASGRKENFPDE
ncbi:MULTISPECIES: hypothetical protein [Alphaproteobacteria]|uniref:hypothetical protein n=1 Tax=Alphaproteobacteria TaxID=28211 RepID=UPI0032989301